MYIIDKRRKVDEEGRVVIPFEARQLLGINPGDDVTFYVEGENIILKKHQPNCNCIFCISEKDVKQYKGKYICKSCIKDLKIK